MFAVLLAACDSASGSATIDAPPACQVGGVVNGTWRDGFPTNTPHTFGAITAVRLWSEDTTGVVEEHLTLSDGTYELHIRQGGAASTALVQDITGGDGDGGSAPTGPGEFTRAGDPCVTGMLSATLDRGSLDGSYTAIDLGLNP